MASTNSNVCPVARGYALLGKAHQYLFRTTTNYFETLSQNPETFQLGEGGWQPEEAFSESGEKLALNWPGRYEYGLHFKLILSVVHSFLKFASEKSDKDERLDIQVLASDFFAYTTSRINLVKLSLEDVVVYTQMLQILCR